MALFGFGKKKQEEQAAAQRAAEARIAAEKKAAEEARIAAEKKAAEEATAAEVAAFTITDEDSVTAALSRGVELYQAGMPAQALVLFQKGAEHGNRYAQSMLASLYQRGEGTEQDYKKARYWYLQSAKQGYAEAQFNSALMLVRGEGGFKRYLTALEWFEKAAKQGHEGAKKVLAQDLGTPEQKKVFVAEGCFQEYEVCLKVGGDPETARKWLDKAAELDCEKAKSELKRIKTVNIQFEAGDRFYQLKDWAMAYGCFLKAAELGHAEAQYKLGCMYESGLGVAKDLDEAVRWYTKSAEQGFVDAQYYLGLMYKVVLGMEQLKRNEMKAMRGEKYEFHNYNEQAYYWYFKAAEQGHADAQYAVGEMHLSGEIEEADEEQGIYWLVKAAEQEHEEAIDLLVRLGVYTDSDDEEE